MRDCMGVNFCHPSTYNKGNRTPHVMIAVSADTYFYPPRPENACSPAQIGVYEADGWWAQTKFDGTCGVFTVSADGRVRKAMTRHGSNKPMVRWTATPEHFEHLASLCDQRDPSAINVFVGEVLHGRVKAKHLAKTPIIIHDILVHNGKHLFQSKYGMRFKAYLAPLAEKGKMLDTHYELTDRVGIIRNVGCELSSFYYDLERKRKWFPEYEGVVLKNPNARLEPCTRQSANSSWQIKSRFPTDKDGVLRRSF